MLNKVTKQRIDTARDILVGQLPLPSDQINMITLALVYKFMNDIDEENAELGEAEFFVGELAAYTWRKILDNTAASASENLAERRKKLFFEGIDSIRKATHIPALFQTIFSQGNIPQISDSAVFGRFLDNINLFKYDHSEELGNAFEYLLMTMGTQAKNGQFRTPRHIIDFIVEAVAPDKTDTFLDPACGTAGFLIAAYNYILWKYTSDKEKEALMELTGEIWVEEEKTVKKVVQKTTVLRKIYSSATSIYLESKKKEDNDEELTEGEYLIKNAEVVWKKQTFRIENATLTHNGTHWQVQITGFQLKMTNTYSSVDSLPSLVTLKPIRYGDMLKPDDKKHFNSAFQGYDNTPLMVRLAKVNMYLHDLRSPQIHDYDTISSDGRWDYIVSCILANPPFMTPKGGVKAHGKFSFKDSTKAEILFSDYILSHLTVTGKAGFIVPEGIIFTNNTDYTALRKQLINDLGLWCVISLPAGVFQPYSGVKTSIMMIDKELARKTNNILLIKIENDGYSLNTNRNPLETTDLPNALRLIENYKSHGEPSGIGNEQTTPLSEGEGAGATVATGEVNFSPFSSGDRGWGIGATKHLILEKNEFAKLDAYKAANVAWDILKKTYKEVSKYQEQIANTANPSKKQLDKLEELEQEFLKNTDFFDIPANETALKEEFKDNLKSEAIAYGAMEEAALADIFKKAIDEAREYNLSYDKYAFGSEEGSTEYEMVYLGDLIEFTQQGILRRAEEVNNPNDKIPYIKMECIEDDGVIHKNKIAFTSASDTEIEQYQLVKNDFLLNVRNSFELVGKSAIYKGEFDIALFNHMILRFRFNESKVMPDFVNIITMSSYFKEQLNQIKKGSTSIWAIYQNDFETIQIPLPPLPIQEKIVAEIEKHQILIKGARLLIDHYTPTFEIKEEWERVRLGEVCESILSGFSCGSSELDNGDIPHLRPMNIS